LTPLVSVAVVNWNGDKYIHRCLEHVFAQSHRELDVIVVDNGSTDGSLEKIKARYGDRCRYIENAGNVGYSPGMNQAMAAAKGEFIVQLNSDACLHEDFISNSLARMRADQRIGSIGGRVFQWDGDELTNQLRKAEGGRYYWRKRFQVRANESEPNEALSFGPASCFPLLRMSALNDVLATSGHYFDDRFFAGWEDNDLWFRMQLRGWKCLFIPEAYGWHVGSGSAEKNTTFFTKNVEYRTRILRNRLFIIVKNLPAGVFLRLFPYLVVGELAMVPYFLLRSPSSIPAFFNGWRQFWAQRGEVWAMRRRIQKSVAVSTDYVWKFFETV
jgi:GT2 family glycosyltransferase